MRTLNTTEEIKTDKRGKKYIHYKVEIVCELCGARWGGSFSRVGGRRYNNAIREAIEHKCSSL